MIKKVVAQVQRSMYARPGRGLGDKSLRGSKEVFEGITGGMTKSSLPMRSKRRTVPVLSAKASRAQSWLHATRRHWGFGSFGTVGDRS